MTDIDVCIHYDTWRHPAIAEDIHLECRCLVGLRGGWKCHALNSCLGYIPISYNLA